MRACIAILLAGAVLLGCAPRDATNAGRQAAEAGPRTVPSNPFFGAWSLASARIAPWWDKKGDAPEADPALTTVTFAANKASGAPIASCDKPEYAVSIVEARTLFEGKLADPAAEAQALGFKDKDITMMTFSCAAGSRDVSLDFPMVDQDTILLGLDNVIYRLKRTGG